MNEKLQKLYELIEELYANSDNELLFHGWHHVNFVYVKSKAFAESLGVDTDIVQAAALVHDLNYLVDVKSSPGAGEAIRVEQLTKAGYSNTEIKQINTIIIEEDIATRDESISKEAQALSDADSLFKILPTSPVLFANRFITENKSDLHNLAKRIVTEQVPLFEKGIYFYSDLAKEKYLPWAKTHFDLWREVSASLEDDDVIEMLRLAGILE